jgi:hypothetical protein
LFFRWLFVGTRGKQDPKERPKIQRWLTDWASCQRAFTCRHR